MISTKSIRAEANSATRKKAIEGRKQGTRSIHVAEAKTPLSDTLETEAMAIALDDQLTAERISFLLFGRVVSW